MSARVVVTVTEYVAPVWRRRSDGTRVHPEFPHGLTDDVTYDESCKALAFMLNQGCDVSVGRTGDSLREASGGALGMSSGMVWNLGKQFAARSREDREELFLGLAAAPVMHVEAAVNLICMDNGDVRHGDVYCYVDTGHGDSVYLKAANTSSC